MKIALVGFKLSIGNSLFMEILADRLKRAGELVYMCGEKKFFYHKNYEGLGLCSGGGAIKMFLDTINVLNWIRFFRFIMDTRPDVVYFIASHPLNNVGIVLLKVYNKLYNDDVKSLSHIHDPVPHLKTKYRFAIYLSQLCQMKISDKICVFGKGLADYIVRRYKIPRDKILYIRHGAHRIKDRQNLYPDYGRKELVYVSLLGRIEEYKGVDIFLQAAKKVISAIDMSENKVIFLIGGEGNLGKYYRLIDEIPSKNLEIRNYLLSNEEFDYLLQRSFCCVLPYKDASQTGNIQIAYYNACPVIVTNTGSLSELVVDRETGFITSVNDVDSIAEKIIFFIKNPYERMLFGRRAFEFYKENLTWGTIISDFILKLRRLRNMERC